MDPMKSRRIADLDVVDITQNLGQARELLALRIAKAAADIRRLDAELRAIAPQVGNALRPVPVNHPTADDQDDDYWATRGILETGFAAKHEDLVTARNSAHTLQAELLRLDEFDDPLGEVAKGVIVYGWEYLKDRGFGSQRCSASSPSSLGGLPLAKVVWETRNQVEHVTSPKKHVVTTFDVIMNAYPASFGISQGPVPLPIVKATLRRRAWAREILILLGWTSRRAAASGLVSIR